MVDFFFLYHDPNSKFEKETTYMRPWQLYDLLNLREGKPKVGPK